MKRISAGGAGGVGVRERGAAGVAQIAPGIDAFTRHTGLQRQQDPLVRLKLKRLYPLRTVGRTRRARWRSEPRVSRRRRTARWRRRSATLWSCRRWRVENRAALECRMATTFTARRGGHQCDNCLKGSHTRHLTLDIRHLDPAHRLQRQKLDPIEIVEPLRTASRSRQPRSQSGRGCR